MPNLAKGRYKCRNKRRWTPIEKVKTKLDEIPETKDKVISEGWSSILSAGCTPNPSGDINKSAGSKANQRKRTNTR